MSLSVRFWGTRGSCPAPGAHTVRYGGNTPCIEIRTATGHLVILDAGTGLRELGRSLTATGHDTGLDADIFLTHAHWDHVQGLPFFEPIYRGGNAFRIWGADELLPTITRVVREQMATGVFPVSFDELPSKVEFHALASLRYQGDGFDLDSFRVRHPGGALGYRIQAGNGDGAALVYISDNELGAAAIYDSPEGWRDDLISFTRGASVLVHDAMYSPEEYDRHRGWGHSHDLDVVALALDARVRKLVLFHYRPERSDAEVDARLVACRSMVADRAGDLEVVAAAEGLTLTLGREP